MKFDPKKLYGNKGSEKDKYKSACQLAWLFDNGYKVKFVDQTSFSTSNKQMFITQHKDNKIHPPNNQQPNVFDNILLIGMGSIENGLENFKIMANSMDGRDFGLYIIEWSETADENEKYVIFLDNYTGNKLDLSFSASHPNITVLYNSPYGFENMLVENFWLPIKKMYYSRKGSTANGQINYHELKDI